MKQLITEKKYPKPFDLKNHTGNRSIREVFNFPNGTIILYYDEKVRGYLHFETWPNFNIKEIDGYQLPRQLKKQDLYYNILKSIEKVEDLYSGRETVENLDCFYVKDIEELFFKESREDIIEFAFQKHLQLINSDLRFKVNNRIKL
jgi:hypothetical protein